MKQQIQQFAFVCLLIGMFPIAAYSSPEPTLGEVGYAGNGCSETSKPIIKLSSKSLSFIPKTFSLSSLTDGEDLERKKCDIAVGVTVPSGYQVGVSDATMHAFVSLDKDSHAELSVSAGFTGSDFAEKSASLDAGSHQNMELQDKSEQWAACGSDTILRLKASAFLASNKQENAYVTVNSVSVNILMRPCHSAA